MRTEYLNYFTGECEKSNLEKVGDIGFGLLRTTFGRTIQVENGLYHLKTTAVALKILAALASLMLLPVTLLCATVGWLTRMFDEGYWTKVDFFAAQTIPPPTDHVPPPKAPSLGSVPTPPALTIDHPLCTSETLSSLPLHQRLHTLSLDIYAPSLTDLTFLVHFPRLEQLIIRHELVDVGQFLPHNYLRSLRLCSARFNNAQVGQLVDHCPHLRQLSLSSLAITEGGLHAIARLTALENLELSFMQIPGSSFAALAPLTQLRCLSLVGIASHERVVLPSLPQLEVLSLLDVPVNDSDLVHFNSLITLRRLNLSNTQIKGERFSDLQPLLQLERLILEACIHLDATHLATLSNLPQLQQLSLEDNAHIGDEAIPFLSALTSLRELNLRDTDFTAAGISQLQEARADLKIISSY